MLTADFERSELFGSGPGGAWFDDVSLYANHQPRIKELFIWCSPRVHGIHIFYTNGTSAYHGIVTGSFHRITLDEDESITKVYGYAGTYLDKMTICTTKREYGPFGSVTSTSFNTTFGPERELKYIFGRFQGTEFLKIGFADGPIPMKEPEPTKQFGAAVRTTDPFSSKNIFEKGHPSITAITLYSEQCKNYIKGIQLTYSNGETCLGGIALNTPEDKARFDIDGDDYITGVKIYSEYAIDQIEFFTLKQGALGPVGRTPDPEVDSIAKKSFSEKFPSGSRLLYMEGGANNTGEKRDGLQHIKFGYGSLTPGEALVYSKSTLVNDMMARNVEVFDNFDHTNGGRRKIQKVRVHELGHIAGLQVMYDGHWYPQEYDRNCTKHLFELSDDEYLVKITGRAAVNDYLGSIYFHTSKDRTSPKYGAGAGSADYSLSLDGGVIAAFFGRKETDYALRQFGAIFVSGLVARVDIQNVVQDFQNKVEKLGNSFVIGRSLLENNSDTEQYMSVDLKHIDSRSEVVTTGQPFSSSVLVSSYQSSPLDADTAKGALIGKDFLSIMGKEGPATTAKENLIHVAAKVSPKKVLTATAFASNLVVIVPYTADCVLHYAGSSKIKSTKLTGTYSSVSAQVRVRYDSKELASC